VSSVNLGPADKGNRAASQQNLWAPSRNTSKPNDYIRFDRKAAFVANHLDDLCRRGGGVFQRLRPFVLRNEWKATLKPSSTT
jgi:hypothetical protein